MPQSWAVQVQPVENWSLRNFLMGQLTNSTKPTCLPRWAFREDFILSCRKRLVLLKPLAGQKGMKVFMSPVQALMSCPDPFSFCPNKEFHELQKKNGKTYPGAKHFLNIQPWTPFPLVSFLLKRPQSLYSMVAFGWAQRLAETHQEHIWGVLRLQVFLWRCCEIPVLHLRGLDCSRPPVFPQLWFLRENQSPVCYLWGAGALHSHRDGESMSFYLLTEWYHMWSHCMFTKLPGWVDQMSRAFPLV